MRQRRITAVFRTGGSSRGAIIYRVRRFKAILNLVSARFMC
jgi:hypothetical protein